MQHRGRTRDYARLARRAIGAALAGIAFSRILGRLREEDLRGEVAFITGSSRGLGLILARELGREGCRLVICARDADELKRADADLRGRGYDVLAVTCDLADPAQVERAVGQATERFGRVDILVNNAGTMLVGPVQQMTLEDFRDAHRNIFWATLHSTLAVLPGMLGRRHGRVVNVTSIGGRLSPPHLAAYSSAKFATVGLSEGLRAELKRHGVVVTTVVPGLMRTGSYLNAWFKDPQEAEFRWFALAASLPLVSIDAERAARQIVVATKRGEADRTLGFPALVAARFHGLFPGLTADLLAVVDRLLPSAPAAPGGSGRAARGEDVAERASSPALDAATTLGRSAAERFNERRTDRSG